MCVEGMREEKERKEREEKEKEKEKERAEKVRQYSCKHTGIGHKYAQLNATLNLVSLSNINIWCLFFLSHLHFIFIFIFILIFILTFLSLKNSASSAISSISIFISIFIS